MFSVSGCLYHDREICEAWNGIRKAAFRRTYSSDTPPLRPPLSLVFLQVLDGLLAQYGTVENVEQGKSLLHLHICACAWGLSYKCYAVK